MTRDQGAIVGIDLGTTYSLVAALQDGVPVVLHNAVDEQLTPSAVAVEDDGTVLVGAAARARATTAPERAALFFKRDMGTTRSYDLAGHGFAPEQLSALVLGALRADAEAALGQPIREAVVTVPAYFGELQRRATCDACEIAGLPVERIINEPTAAALAYGLHDRERELRAVVLDLGGGTFDVTTLEILEGVIEIQSTAGDARLGGEDFTDALADIAARKIECAHGGLVVKRSVAWARLREACEGAKRRFTDHESATLAVPALPLDSGTRADVELELSREEAEAAWGKLLKRLEGPIHRALRDAGTRPGGVDEVLLVGGATRMPCVARLVARLFGRLPLRTLHPDRAVAMGAAVQAGLKAGHAALDDVVVTDIAPFSLGISTSRDFGARRVEGIFSVILERGTVLPASRVEKFATAESGQRIINVQVYQGEHSLCADNTKLGQYEIKGIPPAPAGDQDIEVRFTYDLNGLLEVETTVAATRKVHTLVIEKSPGALTRREIDQARRAMKAYKLHPRDALPNVTALNRADARYAELTGLQREMLGEAISALRAALEAQDPTMIEVTRSALMQRMADL